MRRLRARMAPVHSWAGLIMGWLLYAIALTGSLSVFNPEITHWMHPELTTRNPDPAASTAAALTWLARHEAHANAWFLSVANERLPCTMGLWNEGASYVSRAMDPVTGSPARLRDTLGGEFFFRFHFDLQLPYPFGRLIAGIAAMALVMTLISGTVIHRRLMADMFTFRPGKGQRSWLDAHNLLGVAALPFHFAIALTGAITLSSLLFPAISGAAYPGHSSALFTDLAPQFETPGPAGKPAPLAPFLPMLHDAAARLEPDGMAQVYLYNPGDRNALMIVTSDNATHIGNQTHVLRYDATTGALVADYTERRAAIAAYALFYGLHVAHFAPPVERWLYFLSGLALAGVIASGTILWINRTRLQNRNAPHRSTEMLHRLNTGVIFGIPLACASFFVIDRVLPWSLPHRALDETRLYLLICAMALLLAVSMGAFIARKVLCGLLVMMLLAITLMSAPWNNGLMQGTAICSLGLALGFLTVMRRT